ncbi:endoplasmic reticulum membrane-associated RNA degradation protein-like isoform X1 [Rhopilema esculentum]|uniref:endoplasmic reticulum membrane-associated RNA degradation protein-like isoform X1 n=1 Tax=Rhopilema esculentum TaxID=499914 RepID=UPI0031D07461
MDSNVSYLSPHVFYLICDMPKSYNCGIQNTKQCCGCSFKITGSCIYVCKDTNKNDKRQHYICNVRHLWLSAERRDFLGEQWCNKEKLQNLISSLNWTGSLSTIIQCLNESTNLTTLSLLKLTVIFERALGDVFSSITKKKCPSLLRDLLNTDCLLEVFGEAPIAVLQTLMGPPASLNLRNVLWHGFPMLGEIQDKFCVILVELIAALGEVLKMNSLLSIRHRQKLKLPSTNLIQEIFPLITTEKDLLLKVFKSTSFIPPGMLPAWKMTIELFLSKRFSDAVILFLPQLEHALRCLFVVVNQCPGRLLTAESDVLYTTFDEMLAKDIDEDKPNKLLTEIGRNLTEMLFDLLFFPEGPRLRDRVSHGEYDFNDVDSTIANYLICIGICFCLKYLFPWRQILKTKSKFLGNLCCVMDSYKSHFHPISFLNREICLAIENIDMVDEIATECHLHLNIDQEHNQCDEINKIVTIYMSIPIVKNFFRDNGEICFDKNSVKRYIKEIINEPRHFLHRPKKELEVTGLLRQIAKQCQTAVLQVITFAREKLKQLENRSLRSRARTNFTAMVSVSPVLISFWQTLLLMVSIESLVAASIDIDDTWKSLIKYLKKCLKYAENISSLSNSSNNKWLECSKVVAQLAELAKGRPNI